MRASARVPSRLDLEGPIQGTTHAVRGKKIFENEIGHAHQMETLRRLIGADERYRSCQYPGALAD